MDKEADSEKYTITKKILKGLRLINPHTRYVTKHNDDTTKKTDSEKYVPIKQVIAGLDIIDPTVRPATKRYHID